MPLPPSSLSVVCSTVADRLRTHFKSSKYRIQVMLGNPAAANGGDNNRLNLFFYQFGPAGLGQYPAPDEPWLIRMHCLITAFTIKDIEASEGENDLRLLGNVMRVFHEHPILNVTDVDGTKYGLQSVFRPVSPDDINHIWSTQHNTNYRPSIAYEMSLVRIAPTSRAIGHPLVGALGIEARGTSLARHAEFTGTAGPWPVQPVEVDLALEGWVPRLCFVNGKRCYQSEALELANLGTTTPTRHVWVAGDPAMTVTLAWQSWDTSSGWRDAPDSLDVSPVTTRLDPNGPIPEALPSVSLPFSDHTGQAVLYARRSYTRADGVAVSVRSDPLLISIY